MPKKLSFLSKQARPSWIVTTVAITIAILFIGLIIYGRIVAYRQSRQYENLLTRLPDSTSSDFSPSPSGSPTYPTPVLASTFYTDSLKRKGQVLYYNETFDFSIHVPEEWFIHNTSTMQLSGHTQLGGGGFSGLKITAEQSKSLATLKGQGVTEKFTSPSYKEAYINRQVPGAGPGQEIYLESNRGDVFTFYCGNCSDEVTNSILNSFKSPAE